MSRGRGRRPRAETRRDEADGSGRGVSDATNELNSLAREPSGRATPGVVAARTSRVQDARRRTSGVIRRARDDRLRRARPRAVRGVGRRRRALASASVRQRRRALRGHATRIREPVAVRARRDDVAASSRVGVVRHRVERPFPVAVAIRPVRRHPGRARDDALRRANDELDASPSRRVARRNRQPGWRRLEVEKIRSACAHLPLSLDLSRIHIVHDDSLRLHGTLSRAVTTSTSPRSAASEAAPLTRPPRPPTRPPSSSPWTFGPRVRSRRSRGCRPTTAA